MLKIYFGELKGSVYNTDVYFKYAYEDEWLMDPLAKEIIKDIDKSEVLDRFLIDSPVLGKIPPTMLSGGTKTLLLMLNEPEKVFNASTCGDDCAKWILEIAKRQDLTINLGHLMDFGSGYFEIEILNTGEIVNDMVFLW